MKPVQKEHPHWRFRLYAYNPETTETVFVGLEFVDEVIEGCRNKDKRFQQLVKDALYHQWFKALEGAS